MKPKSELQIAIVGAGHNGLVCASYLAKAGFSVSVFESRQIVGGLCVTEELFPGFQVSSVASYYGMLRPQIVDELALLDFGLETYLTNPAEVVLLPDEQYIFTPRDHGSKYKIANLTPSDLQGWQEFWSDIGRAARLLAPLYFAPETSREQACHVLSKAGLPHVAAKLFDAPLLALCSDYFSNEALQAAAATCTPGFANSSGTVFGCIHHGTANTQNQDGAWGLCKGGMGAITQALARSVEASGGRIYTNSAVSKIRPVSNTSYELTIASGTAGPFDIVVSNADLRTTCRQLLNIETQCPEAMEVSYLGAGKVHFALNSVPKFNVLDKLGCGYSGIIVSAPSLPELVDDSEQVRKGELPMHPMMTMAIPSLTDPACAPQSKHLLTLDLHQLPTTPADGWTDQLKDRLLKRIVAELSRHCQGFDQYIEDVAIITPDLLRSRYNVRSESCHHLPLTPEFLFEGRNAFGFAGYRASLPNVYVCGSGTYGGGNVSGVPGANCAREILKTLQATS